MLGRESFCFYIWCTHWWCHGKYGPHKVAFKLALEASSRVTATKGTLKTYSAAGKPAPALSMHLGLPPGKPGQI